VATGAVVAGVAVSAVGAPGTGDGAAFGAGAGTVAVTGPVAGAGATDSGGACAHAIPARKAIDKIDLRIDIRIRIDIDIDEAPGIGNLI